MRQKERESMPAEQAVSVVDDDRVQLAVERAGATLLRKPFGSGALMASVTRALARCGFETG